ncbi:MAG: LPS assembly lipoprotein LptE [Planctomycetota bacterium]|nr:LPS assembly lipoprotein LptE [Planctomycetota bacterium]
MRASLPLLLALILLCGCYRPALTDIPPGTVYIDGLRNETFYYGLDEKLNRELSYAVNRTGSLKIVNDGDVSDYVLGGTIKSVYKDVIRTGEDDLPLEYRYRCVLHIVFEGERIARRSFDMIRSWRYIPPYGETQESVLDRLTVFLAEEVARTVVTSW